MKNLHKSTTNPKSLNTLPPKVPGGRAPPPNPVLKIPKTITLEANPL
jgi:hypothetical protein